MDGANEQLKRVLQLALHSPFEGERAKAAALLVQRLQRAGLTLSDLDPSFGADDGENALRQRADLPYEFEVTLKSREEALLYHGLLQRSASSSAVWLESHRLLCTASPTAKQSADDLFAKHMASLQRRLAEAQQRAMREYNDRRKVLFEQAVVEELRQADL
ncbi:hypothetical protein [Deinococcus apachensis]|uniref:hypothetical protein n=1 Tax=Deinococcus apachensis TaxID=309886 RepID=UPI00037E1702|nr:hypothetical protein [Deinococcus apachensis]